MSNKYEDLVKGMTIKDFLNEKFDDMIDLIREGILILFRLLPYLYMSMIKKKFYIWPIL